MEAKTMDSLASMLSSKGIRLTRQRRAVLDVLEKTSSHLSVKNWLRLAQEKDKRINRATVYRTITLLKEAGLIDELDLMHLEGEQHYYERRRSLDHVHICCAGCGRIQEMETDLMASLTTEIRQRTGFVADSVRVEVKALCPTCQIQR